jgi:diguanylate cyclase (GGDEF)-like protein
VKGHRSLRALLVDVPPAHRRVLERALGEAGWAMEAEHADGADALSAALQHRGWNAVLYGGDADQAVPARKALALVRLADPHLPFIAVSPLVRAGDLAAVVHGLDADVAVVPDPARLPAALTRALDATRLRRRVGGAHRLLLAQQAITDAIAAGLETDALASHVLATLGDTLGWSCGAVWRPADDGLLRCSGTWHVGERPEIAALAEATQATVFAPGQGLPGGVYAFRRPRWVADVGRDGAEPRAARARRAGLMTAVAFPIAHGDRCAGVIEFFSQGINEPNAEIAALFATVGGQLAQYLERRRSERAERPRAGDERLRRLLDATGSLVVVLDRSGRVKMAGARTCAALGRDEASLLEGEWAAEAVPPEDRPAFAAALASASNGEARVVHALTAREPRQDPRRLRWRLAPVEGDGETLVLLTGEPPALPAIDQVTGLADRASLESSLSAAIDYARADGSGVAIVQLDVDDVRLVTESLGRETGDALLRELASRLQAALPDAALLARRGGEELVAVLDGTAADAAGGHAETALAALGLPVHLHGASLRVSPSAGVVAYPRDAAGADELLARASRATDRAKQMRRGSWASYAPGHTGRLDSLSTAAGLHLAMERDELELHWQPIFGLHTRALVGLEALLRWHHPERGLVLPGEFIPIAEQTGVIEELGDWVLRAVCVQQVAWGREGLHPLLSFNTSPTELRRADYVQRVAAVLRESGADATRLTAELTESSTLEDPVIAEARIRELHGLGLRIALDDFGSGYSSLSRLSELPVTALKIDRAFLRGVPERPDACAIVTAILQLAKALGRIAIAEGVETEAQREFLVQQGCPLAQGFLLGEPVPASEAALLMTRPGAQSVSVAP